MSSVGVLGSGYLDARHRKISPRLDTLDELATGRHHNSHGVGWP
jgi:hypothetical protein